MTDRIYGRSTETILQRGDNFGRRAGVEVCLATGRTPGRTDFGASRSDGLNEKLQRYIRQKRQRKIRQLWITAGSIAAMAVLILSFRETFTTTPRPGIQLSDNLKKERFENALRVLGNALEDEKTPVQRVLYEDHNLIIAIE